MSLACHVPAAGVATSANQKYGGPPRRSRDLAATLPSGAISESSPSSGFSAAKHDAQRRALPRRERRGQHREFGGVVHSRGAEPWACDPQSIKGGPTVDRQSSCRSSAISRTGSEARLHPLTADQRDCARSQLSWHNPLQDAADIIDSSQLQQHEPFPIVQRAFDRMAGGSVSAAAAASSIGQRRRNGLLTCRELQVVLQVHLPGADGLIDVTPDGVNLPGAHIDRDDHLAMRATDRTHSAPPPSSARMRSRTASSVKAASTGSR